MTSNERLGGTRTIRVNVCLVAATNHDLGQMAGDGRLRSDRYSRLNVSPVVLPPCASGAKIFRCWPAISSSGSRVGWSADRSIPTPIMDALVRYPWPGNVRELQNVIERAVILSPGPALHIPPGDLKLGTGAADMPSGAAVTLADAEREHILRALRAVHWVLRGPNGAAARLGMKRSTLQWKMKKLGLSRPE